MHPLVLLALLGLACYRLTRLVVADDFPPVRGPRHRLLGWSSSTARSRGRWPSSWTRREWLGDLVSCHWCASGWVALGLVAAVDLLSRQPVPLPPVFWLAVWAVGAALAHVEPEK